MKKLLLLLFFVSMFTSCAAQQVEQRPLYKIKAYVNTKYEDRAILSSGSYITYEVPNGEFEEKKQYVFWIDIIERNGNNVIAVVEKYAITTWQAQQDQQQASRSLSERTIIRQ